MIRVELFPFIAVFLFLTILLVIGRWIFYNYREGEGGTEYAKYLQQCPYCAYLFLNYEKTPLTVCPRCESYITRETPKEK